MDEEIYKIITDTYNVFEPALRKQIEVRKKHASEGIDMAASFEKPSAENFNLLKVAMLTYQYWVQKG